jgi:glycosyltransferase involved in cell wall biosynthesis|tara:strand:+ start:370 stop:1062 length:693 start_codon:yes stop_codon:yes gene_type:complete
LYRGFVISVVIPCHNEENSIVQVITVLPSFIDEIIVVDNASTDNTSILASNRGAKVVLEEKKGYGYAHKKGFKNAGGDIIVTLDGDGQHPSNSISEIIDYIIKKDLDFVSGTRFPLKNNNSMSLLNILGNKIQTYTFRFLFGCKVLDSQSGMWLFKRDILDRMKLTSNGMSFSEEIKIEAIQNNQICFGEFWIDHTKRIGNSKLMPWYDGFMNMIFMFKRWIQSKLYIKL